MSGRLFITFEGTDGSGKSTQIRLLEKALISGGFDPVVTREPGGTRIGELIRSIILDTGNTEISDVAEMMLYAASRAQHVDEVIRPNLEAGRIVISDRFVDSSIAYQGGARGLGNAVQEVNAYAVRDCVPDLTFFLLSDPVKLFERIERKDADRIEAEGLEVQRAARAAYEKIAAEDRGRVVVIDASRPANEIHAEIAALVGANLKKQGGANERGDERGGAGNAEGAAHE
ncbi:MAG: dTMP kinase [Clostridiales Family XIII bacterium]|jgi:dTMP kinase|nr:dTMP kinase [Clostridiales Family XIII bacterium]